MALELLESMDIHAVVAGLSRIGGVSVPILPAHTRSVLLAEAAAYTYAERERVVGPANVRQEVSGFNDFPPHSLFFELRDRFQRLLAEKFNEHANGPALFSAPLNFNDLSLQRYERGALGITPHLDPRSRIHLVCVFTLTGAARFCLCEDRSGANPVELDVTPGTVILLRAPGFLGSQRRPFHFVADVRELRITFGLRQKS